ncbi:oligosaccharide flippase family protein [Viscerimonas tarda]
MKNSLKTNVIWMFIGNSLYAFMQWIQLSIIAKLCSPIVLGSYTLALAITAPIFLFLSFQLRSLIVTDSKKEWNFSSYFMLRFISLGIGVIFIIGYILIRESEFKILFLIAVLKIVEGFAEIFNAQQQLMEKMHNVAKSLILKGISATTAIFIGVFFFKSLPIGLAIAIFLNLFVLYYNDYLNCKRLYEKESLFNFRNLRLKSLFIKSLPLGIVMCIISLNTNISKYMTEYFLGTEKQGIYSTIAYCLVLGNFVNAAVGQSFSPRMSRYYAENKTIDFKKLCIKYVGVNLGVGIILSIMSLIGGYHFLKIMFSDSIANYSGLFSLVMFSGIFLYTASALGYTLTSMRIFKIQPFINGMVMITNIVGCYFLLNKYGIYGVVYASILAFSMQIIITSCFIYKNYDKSCSRSRSIR